MASPNIPEVKVEETACNIQTKYETMPPQSVKPGLQQAELLNRLERLKILQRSLRAALDIVESEFKELRQAIDDLKRK